MRKLYVHIVLALLLFTGSMAAVCAQDKYETYVHTGDSVFRKGDYAAYMKIATDALRYAEASGNCVSLSRAHLKMASAYYFLQEKNTSLQWMLTGRKIAVDCHTDSLTWIADRQIGAIYFEQSKDDSCLYYLKEAEQLLNKTDSNYAERSYLYAILGELKYRHLKDTANGKQCFDKALAYAIKANDTIKLAFANVKLGSFYNSEGQCRRAIGYYQQAVSLYRAAKLPEGLMYAIHMLAWAYSECGEAKLSYEAMLSLKNLRDSIFKDETAIKTAEYRTLYETEKKERENLLLQKQNAEKERKAQTILISSIAGFLLLIAAFWVIYTRYKHRKKAEMDERIALQQKLRFKAVMEAEEKERVRIARELHDSLGQMLSAAKMNISAMDSYHQDEAKLVNNATKLIDDSVKEVRNISHNLMPASLMEKGIETALNELAAKINDTGLLQIDLLISTGEQRLDSSAEIAIYRIVQEVVNNMIKHSKANRVEVMLDYNAEKVYLSIKDNGVGFDTANIETSTGIGWRNIFSRVYMMNGDVQIQSQPGRGTLVNIEFAK
ncbi:hypothetical protein CAP35_14185 [Chitinophagaceae bacterium IBVUCB1]|nr:hypothetical protein CAP35_14185 [Chitinophagaceae bacterium IBVUCB1]